MANAYAHKIQELEGERRIEKRKAKRAAERRSKALRDRRWQDARDALRVARRHRREARQLLKRIRVLRKARKRASWLARRARHNRKVLGRTGLMWLNGRAVPRWIYDDLMKAKARGWWGIVVSGVRTTKLSISLCWAMCGAPFCRGRCAGASSNHNADPPYAYPDGAVDVTDYFKLDEICDKYDDMRIQNNLPADRVHFSASGR